MGNVETALADFHGQFSFITSRQPSLEALARLVAELDKRITALESSER